MPTNEEYKRLALQLTKQFERELDAKNALALAKQIREYQRLSI